jgi:DNA-binding transcriptional LysR family regulator
MNWDDLRYVLAVGRAGSLSATARLLGVNQTTVARRLAGAEVGLGARLFLRTDGRFRPTEAGEAALAQAERAEHAFGELERAVAGGDAVPTGTVRVTTVPLLANRLLVAALPALHARHERVRVELIAEPRDLSLTKREADIALRLARPHSGTALARRIGRLDYVVFGPDPAPRHTLPWISYVDDLAHLPQARWMAAAERASVVPAPLAANDAEAILQAVQAGLGKSLLPCFLAGQVPCVAPLGGRAPVLSRELWLLVHPDLRPLARVAAVIAWLEATVRRCAAPLRD